MLGGEASGDPGAPSPPPPPQSSSRPFHFILRQRLTQNPKPRGWLVFSGTVPQKKLYRRMNVAVWWVWCGGPAAQPPPLVATLHKREGGMSPTDRGSAAASCSTEGRRAVRQRFNLCRQRQYIVCHGQHSSVIIHLSNPFKYCVRNITNVSWQMNKEMKARSL